MKKEKPAIVYECALKEYILVFKYFMKKAERPHVTGFVNAHLLSAKPDSAEMEGLVQLALKHGVLVRDGGGTKIKDVVATFLNAWTDSLNVAAIKKPSFSDQKGLFFAKVEGMYLAVWQDAVQDKAVLAADSDLEILYDHFRTEIEKKDVDKQFNLKKANKAFAEKGSGTRLEISPVNRLFLQCINNATGKNCLKDELLHVGKKELEEIILDDVHCVSEVKKRDSAELKETIVRYIDHNCGLKSGGKSEDAGKKVNDVEYYTRLSFIKLTRNEKFPKGLFDFLKMTAANLLKSVADWKNLLRRVILCILMSVLTLVWNIYALCYLNDTFNIQIRAIFGKATAYLLAGVANTSSVIGLPPFVRTVNTVTITASLYFLLAIALSTVIKDVVSGKAKSNFSHVFSFGRSIKNYLSVARRGLSYYIWVGLAAASVINLVVFNPFAVFLLAVMLLFSCMKCEDGGITPFFMIINSSIRYKSVMSGKRPAPLFGKYQLRLFGISVGLIACSVLNAVLWFAADFNFWIRLAVSAVLIILSFLKLGIIKVSKPTAAAIFLLSAVAVQLVMISVSFSGVVLADDGGWSESGGTLAGLMRNSGWPTILGFSLVLALAVAAGCLTLGLGSAIVAGAAAATFGAAALGATFTNTGREAAYDFIWGNYSPYGGDSKLAAVLNLGVSLVPGFGDAFGVITGMRDCSYDIREGDMGALALDGFGFALDMFGLAKTAEDLLKYSDDVADIAGKSVSKLDGGSTKSAQDIIGERTKDLDLTEHPTKYKQLGSQRMKEIKGKIDARTATREEYDLYDWNTRLAKRRNEGINNFWDQERKRILSGEPTTRNWSDQQVKDILAHKTPTYDGKPIAGHHSYSVSKYPHLANKGEVIYPATANEHFNGWHGGNYRNSLPGKPIEDISDF